MISSTWSGSGCAAHGFERLRAFDAGLAGRDAQVDSLRVAEETQVRVRGEERVPLESGLGDQHLALVAAGAARRGADRVAGLDREQRLVAVDDVDRRERALEMRRELIRQRGSVHRRCACARRAHAGFFAACSRRTICCTASVCISVSSRCSCASRASTSDSLNV